MRLVARGSFVCSSQRGVNPRINNLEMVELRNGAQLRGRVSGYVPKGIRVRPVRRKSTESIINGPRHAQRPARRSMSHSRRRYFITYHERRSLSRRRPRSWIRHRRDQRTERSSLPRRKSEENPAEREGGARSLLRVTGCTTIERKHRNKKQQIYRLRMQMRR